MQLGDFQGTETRQSRTCKEGMLVLGMVSRCPMLADKNSLDFIEFTIGCNGRELYEAVIALLVLYC